MGCGARDFDFSESFEDFLIFLGPGGMWSRIRRSTLCRVHQFSSKSEHWEPLSSTPPLFVLFGVLRTPFFRLCVCVVWVCLFCVCVCNMFT